MTVTFAADGSSFQGTINWLAVKAAGYGAGTEKVTQGTDYANPFWASARGALGAAASPTFTPGCYHYLTAGNGAGQADWFASHAAAIPGFVIWVDLERAPGVSPTVADARAFVTRLRTHYPSKRIGLYAGESFTGNAKLTFADMLWSPHYVEGEGTPAELYKEVPASWWNAYGGLAPTLLQFSQSAEVPGVDGLADVSAHRGTAAQMHAALFG
jgi:GH25 family lysozyme M1 (1,4-beta-N-acetylmuramidase)